MNTEIWPSSKTKQRISRIKVNNHVFTDIFHQLLVKLSYYRYWWMHTAKNKLRQPIFKLLIYYGTFVSLFCFVKCMQDNIQVSMLCVVRKLSVQFHKLFIVNFSKNVLIHNSEIYLFSLIFFSLKRWWKSLSSSINPSDNIWSTRLSNLSSRATEEDEWGN